MSLVDWITQNKSKEEELILTLGFRNYVDRLSNTFMVVSQRVEDENTKTF